MADEKKKISGGVIAAICAVVIAVIMAVVAVVVINVNKTNIVGSYKVTAILDSEGNESSDSLSMLKAFGMDYMIEFKDGNKGVFTVKIDSEKMGSLMSSFTTALTNGETTADTEDVTSNIPAETNVDFTYDGNKITLSTPMTGSTVTEMNYEVKDGAVIIEMSGQKLKFTKE